MLGEEYIKEQNEKIEKLELSRILTEKITNEGIYTLTQLLDTDISKVWESPYNQIRLYEKEKLINLIHMLGLKFNCEFNTEEERQVQDKILDEIRLIGLTRYMEQKGSPRYQITMIEELVYEASLDEYLIEYLKNKRTFIKKLKENKSITTIEQLLELNEIQFNALFSRSERKEIIEALHKLGYRFGFEPTEKEQRQINVKMDNGEIITVENVDVAVDEGKKTEVPQSDEYKQGIEFLNFDTRTYNSLRRRGGISTLHDLLSLTKDKLKKIRTLGQKGYDEVVDKIHSLGYKFADEIDFEIAELETDNTDMHQIMIEYKSKLTRMQELQQQIQLLQQEKQKLDQEIEGFKQQLGEQLGGNGTTK